MEKAIERICDSIARQTESKKDLVMQVTEFVDNCYGEPISPGSIAKMFYVSAPYLSKIFKEKSGRNLSAYITEVRIAKAKELLTSTDKKVADIAMLVGYEDVNYFIRLYKKYTGFTPSKERIMQIRWSMIKLKVVEDTHFQLL